MSAAGNALSALRQAEAAYQRHRNALAVQIDTQERHLDAWPDDWSDERAAAVDTLRAVRREAATVADMMRDLRGLILRNEALCVQLEEPV